MINVAIARNFNAPCEYLISLSIIRLNLDQSQRYEYVLK